MWSIHCPAGPCSQVKLNKNELGDNFSKDNSKFLKLIPCACNLGPNTAVTNIHVPINNRPYNQYIAYCVLSWKRPGTYSGATWPIVK